jgi:hypothetical protein
VTAIQSEWGRSRFVCVVHYPPTDRCRMVVLLEPFSKMHPAEGAAWAEWFERMGLPANEVPLTASILCDDEARTVTFPVVDYDEDGKYKMADDGETILSKDVTIQLEAPALPFPEGRSGVE